MDNNNLAIRLVAMLNKALSKQNITRDVQSLERTPFILRLIGRLNKNQTRTNIQRDLNSIQNNQTITVKAKVDKNSVLNSLRAAQQTARREAQNNPVNIPANVNVNTNGLDRANQAQDEIVQGGSGIRDIVQNYINWNKVIELIVQAMKKAVDTTKELAKAQTNLQIVTGYNHQQMLNLMKDYNQLAKNLSATTVDITDSADGWLRTGKSISETEKLIADSTILSKIGQIEAAEAQKYLTSAMNGFKVETEDVIKIVDKLSATDLVSATSAGGLAEAMSKCANSANIAGVSMDNLIGYIATVSEVTQKSDSVVGESFKTILARMGKVKLGDFIDDDGNDISGEINDVEKVLGKFDIKLRDTAGEFRNFQDVLYDVGTNFSKFSSVEQNAIANAFGGVYQRENVLTLFENFDRAMELAEVSANSSGKALEKYAIYEQSLEAATNRLTAAFESLAYNAIDSDFIAGLADGAAGIVEFVDKAKLLQTGLTALSFTGVIKGLLLLGTKLVAVKNNTVNLTSAMNLSTRAGALNAQENTLLGNSFSTLTAKQQRLILSNKKLSNEQRIAILQTQGLTRAEAEQRLQVMGLITAEQGAATATFSLRGAWEALKLSIASNPLGLIITALTTATMLIGNAIEKQKEQEQAIIDSATAAREESNAISELYAEFRTISKEYEIDTSKKSDLIKVTDTLLEKLGYEKKTISELIGEYGSLDEALKMITLENLGEAENKFISAKDLAEKTLTKKNVFTGKNIWVGTNIDGDYKELDETISEILKESGLFEQVINDRNGVVNLIYRNDAESAEGVKANYKDIGEALDLLKEKYYAEDLGHSSIFKALSSEQESLKKDIDDYNSAIDNLNNNVAQQQIITGLLGRELPKTQGEFDEFRKSMIDSARASDTWSKKFVGGADMAEQAVDSALQSMPEFSEFFQTELPKSTETSVKALSKVADKIKTLKDKMDDFIGTAEKFSNALEKIITGENLTWDELNKLLEINPELIYSVKMVDGKYTIDKNKLQGAAFDYGEQNNPYKADYEQSQQRVTELEQQLASLQAKSDDPRVANGGLTKQISDIDNELRAARQELEANEKLYNAYQTLLNTSIDTIYGDKIADTFKDIETEVKSQVGDYNTGITNLNKALASMNEGQALTYDEMTELVKQFPELNGYIKESADGFSVEADALNTVLKKAYETRDAFVDSEKIKTEQAISETKDRIQVWQIELNILEKVGELETDRAKELQGYIDSAAENLDLMSNYLIYLDSLKNKTYTTNGSNSTTTDYLQNEIDYYNTIIDAIEAVTDKKIEAIDKEIEGLEKQKDALEEANDERERELDLIEARNNLDKAKKQTVFVYEEGKGFVEKADEKAIADAQKEYDDIVNQIAIDDIDKQIEEQEAIKESFEDYKEQFTELSSNVEKIIAIEQAKVALGADEEGLLNLSDDQKQQITSGLAGAILEKDIEDNKDNSKYKKLTLNDVLKRFGATVTADTIPESFKQSIGVNATDRMLSSIAGQDKTMTNVTYNNGSTQVSTVFNINGKLSVDDVAKAVNDEMKKVLQQFVNSVKQ